MINVAILAGGDSSEAVISYRSAKQVAKILDKAKFNAYTIMVKGSSWSYEASEGNFIEVDKNDFSINTDFGKIKFDFALILIHGTPGENGILQGYFEIMRIPYSSCNVAVSAVTFDKSLCKGALKDSGIAMAREVLVSKGEKYNQQEIIEKLSLPLFVKPNASGSSFGVTKVKDVKDLDEAIEKAFSESEQVLLEEFIEGREISCGVMIAKGNEYIFPITEIVSKSEFFDFDAKYNGLSEEITPADFPSEVVKRINGDTLKIYKGLKCSGIVRVDFIVKNDIPYFIEINTIPGMSERSIIPQQAAAIGMSMQELFSIIIEDKL